MEKQIEAHLLGLGLGYLPLHRIESQLASGELVTLQLANNKSRNNELSMASRKDNQGKALAWFVNKIQEMEGKLIKI